VRSRCRSIDALAEAVGGKPRLPEQRVGGHGFADGVGVHGVALVDEDVPQGQSTRDIAAEAGVPAQSLQYYFENKEGLYAACIEDIQMSANRAVGPALEVADELLRAKAGTAALIDAYIALDALHTVTLTGVNPTQLAQHDFLLV
jgi:tetracycline repressor-like protein